MSKCLRCGAGSEWIQGRVTNEVVEFIALDNRLLKKLIIAYKSNGGVRLNTDDIKTILHALKSKTL